MTRIEFMQRAPTQGAASQVNLFAAPLLVFRWEEAEYWRDEICAVVGNRSDRKRMRARSDLPAWPDRATRMLTAWAAACASQATAAWRQSEAQPAPKQWRMEGHAILTTRFQPQPLTDHAAEGWNWSGRYFAMAAEGDAIVFEDIGGGIQTDNVARRSFRYAPSEGELLLWPSWLSYRTEMHDDEQRRLALAFNFHSAWLERPRLAAPRTGFLGGAEKAPPGVDVDVDENL